MASASTTPNTNQAAEGDLSAEERAIINAFEEGRLCAAEALAIEPGSEHEGEGHEGEERHETMVIFTSNFIKVPRPDSCFRSPKYRVLCGRIGSGPEIVRNLT